MLLCLLRLLWSAYFESLWSRFKAHDPPKPELSLPAGGRHYRSECESLDDYR